MRRWLVSIGLLATAGPLAAQPMSTREFLALPQPAPDTVIKYGADSLQFGELYRPRGGGRAPVVVLIHGGCWLAQYNGRHIRGLAAALAREGMAVWSIEYRRVGNPGGGWPGTFEDVAAGVDHVRRLAEPFSLDTTRVVVAGHSAGGHLALWAGGRHRFPAGAPGAGTPLAVVGVVGLAPVPDPGTFARESPESCGTAVQQLMGGDPDRVPDRYRMGSPVQLLPLGVTQILLNGQDDRIVPPGPVERYAERATAAGDRVSFRSLPNAGHFEVVAPETPAGRRTIAAITSLATGRRGPL